MPRRLRDRAGGADQRGAVRGPHAGHDGAVDREAAGGPARLPRPGPAHFSGAGGSRQSTEALMGDTPRKKRSLKLWLALLLIPNLLGAAGYFAYQRWFDTYHLKTVQEGALYRDGVQSIHQFKTAVN